MGKFEKLDELAVQLDDAVSEVEQLTFKLKEAQENKRFLQEDVIPEALRDAGRNNWELPSGKFLSLEHELKVRVPKNAADEAYAYLEDIGEGGMIKRSVVCDFRQDQQEEAVAALEALRHAGFHQARIQKEHHWATLQAWVKSKFEDGQDVPRELFGVHERDVAQVKLKV